MSGDPYQLPSFAWRHALRDALAINPANVNISESVTAATPESWIADNQARRLVVLSGSGAITVLINRGIASRSAVDRLIVPAGHNLSGRRIGILSSMDGTYAALTEIFTYSRLRGSAQVTSTATMHGGTNVFDFPPSTSRYLVVSFSALNTQIGEIGELWLTTKERPTAGYSSGYAYGYQPNVAINLLRSGADAVVELGSQKRTLSVTTPPIAGGDHQLYARMLDEIGTSRDPVWVDPTTSGYQTTIEDMEGTPDARWLINGGTMSNSATRFVGSTSLRSVRTGGTGVLEIYQGDLSVDLRGAIFRASVRIDSTGSPLAAASGFSIYLFTNGTDYSEFQFGTNQIPSYGVWYTLSIDLENDAAAAVSVDDANAGNITGILFRFPSVAVNGAFQVDDIHTITKRHEPWLARVSNEPKWTQVSPVPAGGEYYQRSIEFVESIG